MTDADCTPGREPRRHETIAAFIPHLSVPYLCFLILAISAQPKRYRGIIIIRLYRSTTNRSLDWVLSHWAHFTVIRFIFVLCIRPTVCCMHA